MDSPADRIPKFTVSGHGFCRLEIAMSSNDGYVKRADEEIVPRVSSSLDKSSGKWQAAQILPIWQSDQTMATVRLTLPCLIIL